MALVVVPAVAHHALVQLFEQLVAPLFLATQLLERVERRWKEPVVDLFAQAHVADTHVDLYPPIKF